MSKYELHIPIEGRDKGGRFFETLVRKFVDEKKAIQAYDEIVALSLTETRGRAWLKSNYGKIYAFIGRIPVYVTLEPKLLWPLMPEDEPMLYRIEEVQEPEVYLYD